MIYTRKSTEDEDRQVLSIQAQLAELHSYSAKEKFDIVASFQEAKTAKEPGRTVFAEMLSFIERGKADGIISWHPDRLARNSVDGGKIIHMVDRGLIRSLKFPTFWFEPTPQGLFMLNIAFGQSKYFVDNLRENVKRGLRQKIRNGVWPGRAPVGYLNNAHTRGIDVDKTKADKVRKLFEAYATGAHTLYSLANWCRENNLRGHGNRVMVVSNIQKNLQNIFYTGLMKWKEEIFEGTHEPILTKKLFDKVQEVMKKKGRMRPDKKHIFPLRGLLKCASCGCSITAQYAKGNGGIYTYYRCTKKRSACTERYVGEQNLTNQIRDFLQKVSLSSQDTQKVLAALEQDEVQAKEEARTEAEAMKSELATMDNQLEKLLNLYLADALSTAEYAAKKNKIISEKVALTERVADIEQRGVSWLEPAREFVLSLNQAANLLSQNDLVGMTAFLKNIGANHSLRNRQFEFSPKMQYARAASLCEAASEHLRIPRWCTLQDSNLRPFECESNALTN